MCFWLRINRSLGMDRRNERCERPQAPESLIERKEIPLLCEVSLGFRVHLFCQGCMAKCNLYVGKTVFLVCAEDEFKIHSA